MVRLLAIDGDNTLWTPLSGINLSDRTPTDDIGRPDFEYRPLADDRLIVERDDGVRFGLRPEARDVLEELKRRGVVTGLISYNHEGNVRRILEAFGVLGLFDYVVARWHSNKDEMIGIMLDAARSDEHIFRPSDVLLVDDDPEGIYEGQCRRIGAGFACFGKEVRDLRELLRMVA